MTTKGVTILQNDFPIYQLLSIGPYHFLACGGGGSKKTGIDNALTFFEVNQDNGKYSATKASMKTTGLAAVMSAAVVTVDEHFFIVTAQDDSCVVYEAQYVLVDKDVPLANPDTTLTILSDTKRLSFSVAEICRHRVCQSEEDFVKCVDINEGAKTIAAGTSSGSVLLLDIIKSSAKYSLKPVRSFVAHPGEVSTINFDPIRPEIVASTSKDDCGYLWRKSGTGKAATFKTPREQYRFRCAKYAKQLDKGESMLFTVEIPRARPGKGQPAKPCFVSIWSTNPDAARLKPLRSIDAGTDELCSLATSDCGRFIAVGSGEGTVQIYIAFSLANVYTLRKSHSLFVTATSFLSSSLQTRHLTRNAEVALVTASPDNVVKLHCFRTRRWTIDLFWVLSGSAVLVYLAFWLMVHFRI